jgi:hypothetical protein
MFFLLPIRYVALATVFVITSSVWHGLAHGESYIAGQLGLTVPHALSDVEPYTPNVTRSSTDLQLKKAPMYGAKLGHFFEPKGKRWMPDLFNGKSWLGVEMEAFNTTPHIEPQSQTIAPSGSLPGFTQDVEGQSLRVFTWAMNVIARYPGEKWQPYAGIGLGVFFAHTNNKLFGESQSSTQPGLNTQIGIRYIVTKQLSAFGEWKFNHARFDFEPGSALAGMRASYNVHHLPSCFRYGLPLLVRAQRIASACSDPLRTDCAGPRLGAVPRGLHQRGPVSLHRLSTR